MAQPSVASFFNTRKRAATEDTAIIKTRRLETDDSNNQLQGIDVPPLRPQTPVNQKEDDEILKSKVGVRTRSNRAIKRISVQSITGQQNMSAPSKLEENIKQQKLVQYIQKGPLSPHKKPSKVDNEMQLLNEKTPTTSTLLDQAFISKNNATNIERGLKTPTKQIIKGSTPIKHGELKSLVRKELNFDEVKSKVSRSAKLNELKASLARIQELEKTRKAQELRNRRLRDGVAASPSKAPEAVQLKEFKEIELEVLTSPSKTFKTPTKLPPPTPPHKNELMSPRHTDVSKRILFSPAKNGSPSKMVVPPAYQRFMSLVETSKAGQLPLPFKYRQLIEIFKAVDSVCAMFHNRKECITFKKLKPAVQRMLRKNFTEKHLAQIKHLYPDAFIFSQMKMRNYGSVSKADYFQLVITPNVENAGSTTEQTMKQKTIDITIGATKDAGNGKTDDEDNVLNAAQSHSMNPNVMTERLKYFQYVLLQRVKDEHEKFLLSLDVSLLVPKEKVMRWHPDFDLENCTDIECAHLPQPPNIEKYSSARDILSTARNLFNCATPMERAMERYEAKLLADKSDNSSITQTPTERLADDTTRVTSQRTTTITPTTVTKITSSSTATTKPPTADAPRSVAACNNGDTTATSNLLKGLPKSLVEKIRAKQAAKALDAMTRRPSQDREATNYSRLPELARHLRNVYITERKGVLTLEMVIKKIQNSFRTSLTPQEIESHLRLIAKEIPNWAAFHEVRKTMYLKIAKEMELNKIIEKLETIANEKSR